MREISGKELEKVKDEFVVIDVRTKEEFTSGHIKGAINIYFDEILDHIDQIDKDMPIAIYCRTNNRSEYAALSLIGAGYKYVHVATGVEMYDYELEK